MADRGQEPSAVGADGGIAAKRREVVERGGAVTTRVSVGGVRCGRRCAAVRAAALLWDGAP